jgi:regulatory protein YycH of two-component signal transduction system YycFG
MRYETIKSIVLLILVTFSILLTWMLWTYQPNYDVMEETGKTVEQVSLGEKKTLGNIVRPERLFFHQAENHYGTYDSFEIEQTMKEISLWGFSEFEDISDQVENIPTFIYDNHTLEIIFPDIVPLKVYHTALQLPNNDIPNSNFDRIVVDLDPETRESGVVYFISSKEQEVLRAHVSTSYINDYKTRYLVNMSGNEKYALYEPFSRESYVMLRKDAVKMALYNHLLVKLPTEKFRNALFNDPNLVSKNYSSFGEEYTDSTTLMSVNYETNTVSYVKTEDVESDNTSKSNNLLEKSIDFINSHGGWTDNYRYVGMDESEQFILYRLYDLSGYPIFSDKGVSEIFQIWNDGEITKYDRSNFMLGRRIQATEITLPSAISVIDELNKTSGFELSFLQDITIGYSLTKDAEEPLLLHLEPSWYYKYNDQWLRVESSVNGGIKHGLD